MLQVKLSEERSSCLHVGPGRTDEAADVRHAVVVVELGHLRSYQGSSSVQGRTLSSKPTMRVPSDILSCIDVVGCDSITPSHSPEDAAAAAAAAADATAALLGPASSDASVLPAP